MNTDELKNENENSIEKLGSVEVKSDNGVFYCLSIIGQIEGHYVLDQTQKSTKYDHILPLLLEHLVKLRIGAVLIGVGIKHANQAKGQQGKQIW